VYYGVAKPSGVVAVTGGVATGVGGSDGAVVVVVAVCPSVAEGSDTTVSDGAWTAPRATVNAPIASTAPAPAVADITFNLVEFTSDHSNSISRRQ
jgi:hypothetical protein